MSAATDSSAAADQHHPGHESLVDEMKAEIKHELGQLNGRIDQLDKQIATILQLLTAGGATSQARHAAGDGDTADKRTASRGGGMQSPTLMDTITEQDEDTNSSLEAADDAQQRKASTTEHESAPKLPFSSSGGAPQPAQSSSDDKHSIIRQDLDIL